MDYRREGKQDCISFKILSLNTFTLQSMYQGILIITSTTVLKHVCSVGCNLVQGGGHVQGEGGGN